MSRICTFLFFFLTVLQPPRSTLFPYTTLFRSMLQAKLTGSEQHVIATRPTANSEAHQLYLKGRFFWNKRTGKDRKSTRLNSSHEWISYAVFCLKKKNRHDCSVRSAGSSPIEVT